MPPDTAAPGRLDRATMSPGAIVLSITLLLALQPITTDLYLPTLPTLQRELGASIGAVQLTLSALIICFGFGQLVCGPLADRFGRRPVLLTGMALYTAASVLSAASQTIEALIAWRALQGAALAAAVTCGRSIVRDLFQPNEGARVMSRALGGLGVVGMLAPISGGLLAQWFNWHAALLATAVFGAGTLAFIAIKFEETLPQRNPFATQPAHLWRNWGLVLGNPTFRAWAALLCCTWGGLFFVLAGSSFVFIGMRGTTRAEYGLVLASSSLAYIVGTLLCRRLLLRHGLRGTAKRGALFSLAGGTGMAALSLGGVDTVWALVAPQLMYALGHGVLQPCAQAGVVGPFPDKAGTAASLSGFAMMVTAFAIGLFLGHTLDRSALPMTLGLGAFSIGVLLVAWTLVQRDGDPAGAWCAPPVLPEP
ncbi:MAG: multidrug effflux MFS transporter, partial [Rhizobiales bacterium]|nr:multidrug effflux MFS transporter [Rhizobacter sp.]